MAIHHITPAGYSIETFEYHEGLEKPIVVTNTTQNDGQSVTLSCGAEYRVLGRGYYGSTDIEQVDCKRCINNRYAKRNEAMYAAADAKLS